MPYETITHIDQLIKRVQTYNPDAETDLVRRAYDFSAKAHEGQTRQSGEPYLQHPLAVAGVLTSLRSDVAAIVAGLLRGDDNEGGYFGRLSWNNCSARTFCVWSTA